MLVWQRLYVNNTVFLCRWINYEEADILADNFGRGLRVLGQKHGQPVCMFADTRLVTGASSILCHVKQGLFTSKTSSFTQKPRFKILADGDNIGRGLRVLG